MTCNPRQNQASFYSTQTKPPVPAVEILNNRENWLQTNSTHAMLLLHRCQMKQTQLPELFTVPSSSSSCGIQPKSKKTETQSRHLLHCISHHHHPPPFCHPIQTSPHSQHRQQKHKE
ncbi:hypothetical protein V8G54_031660 [Vigna mungo]|uniref:Uncharacterized protein n=1 Tax=Vigna mungo TaxID=3915 RepID=A0AAQ3MK70_VIGMU